jgi:hypothetical protein
MTRLPTLTTAGWVDDVVTMSAKLIDYFLVSEHSQTQLYRGNITSMTYLVQRYGSEPSALADHTRSQLYNYLSHYFDEVQVNTDADNLDSANGRYNLRIDVMLTKDGQQHSLGRLLEIGDSRILGVTDSAYR